MLLEFVAGFGFLIYCVYGVSEFLYLRIEDCVFGVLVCSSLG